MIHSHEERSRAEQSNEPLVKIAFVAVGDHDAEEYLQGVMRFAEDRDWLVQPFQWAPDTGTDCIEEWQPSGTLVCVAGPGGFCEPQTPFELPGPLVKLGPFSDGDGVWSWADPTSIAKLAVEHLQNTGFEQLVWLGELDDPWYAPVCQEFQRLAREARLPVTTLDVSDELPADAVEDISDELRRCLTDSADRTGVFCVPDMISLVVLQACRLLSRRVPYDIGILTVGNSAILTGHSPSLSSIRIPARRIGMQGAEMLETMLAPVSTKQSRSSGNDRVVCNEVTERDSTRAVSPDIERALRYIHAHAGPGLTVADVVKATQEVSRVTFEKRFKAELQRTPGDEIRRVRIDQARTLLRDSELTITDVALRTGWNSSSRFAEVFRRVTGVSPSEYRVSGT